MDRIRAARRTDVLPEDESPRAIAAPAFAPDPDRIRFVELMRQALAVALALLVPRDRLRLACYYAQEMTLAQTGRLLGEHEATASRQLARTRRAIRDSVEHTLRAEHGLAEAEITECFSSISNDVGPFDLRELLEPVATGKDPALDRSNEGRSL